MPMPSQFRFNRMAFVIFIALFGVEVLIALYVRDPIIRPLFGDVLVVILMFFFLRSLLTAKTQWLALGTLAFAFAVEFAQYFRVIHHLGWQDNAIARTIMGSVFDGKDLVAYTIGVAIAAVIDRGWVKEWPTRSGERPNMALGH